MSSRLLHCYDAVLAIRRERVRLPNHDDYPSGRRNRPTYPQPDNNPTVNKVRNIVIMLNNEEGVDKRKAAPAVACSGSRR